MTSLLMAIEYGDSPPQSPPVGEPGSDAARAEADCPPLTLSKRSQGIELGVFLLLSRNGESPREIGWTFKKGPRSIVFATLTFPLILYGISFAQILWLRLG